MQDTVQTPTPNTASASATQAGVAAATAGAEAQPMRRKIDPARTRRRKAAEWRYQAYGLAAIGVGAAFLVILFTTIISKGYPAFFQTTIQLDVTFDEQRIDPAGTRELSALQYAPKYRRIARQALYNQFGGRPSNRRERRQMHDLLSNNADAQLRDLVVADPSLIGTTQKVWVLADGNIDALEKGAISRDTPNDRRLVKDQQIAWLDQLHAEGRVQTAFNPNLFTAGASSKPESAGVGVALIGSLFMMLTVVLLAVPLGVMAAIYLEEFAPRNKLTDLIEVNINNLAAVPSIVFGLLGLGVFINIIGLPRSASLIGGLVLTLMTLPTIIIATRAAVRAIPPSIRQAALGVGASKMQTVTHHVLPLALPGILTGTIIGLVQALGETAPLLMIGMVAFVQDFPTTPLEPATALPVQIYMWATSAERGFVERTAGATMILLGFLFLMNATAVILRQRFEKKW